MSLTQASTMNYFVCSTDSDLTYRSFGFAMKKLYTVTKLLKSEGFDKFLGKTSF